MQEVSLKRIDKLSKKELRQAIEDCFEEAPERDPVDRLAILQEAQFYTQELDRRHDSWISIRDFLLEIAVLGLISWEIHMGYQQQTHQDQAFEKEKVIWEHMDTSTKATADTMTALKTTTEIMSDSLQKQVALFYDVQINVIYNEGPKKLTLINTGRSNVTLWSQRVGEKTVPLVDYPKSDLIPPAGTYEIPLEEFVKILNATLPKDQMHNYEFTFLIKNEKQERFTIDGDLIAVWRGDTVSFNIPSTRLVPGWNRN